MNSNWQTAPGTVSCKSYWTQWGGRAAEGGAAPWKPQIQGGWSWLASHWATGSDPCPHSHPETRHCRALPQQPSQLRSRISDSYFINPDKSCSLSPCLGKQRSFPKHQEWAQFQILVAGTLLSTQRTTAPDEGDRLPSLLVPQQAIQH